MDSILLTLLVLMLGATLGILYLNLRSKPKDENENKGAEEIANLKTEIVILKDILLLIVLSLIPPETERYW